MKGSADAHSALVAKMEYEHKKEISLRNKQEKETKSILDDTKFKLDKLAKEHSSLQARWSSSSSSRGGGGDKEEEEERKLREELAEANERINELELETERQRARMKVQMEAERDLGLLIEELDGNLEITKNESEAKRKLLEFDLKDKSKEVEDLEKKVKELEKAKDEREMGLNAKVKKLEEELILEKNNATSAATVDADAIKKLEDEKEEVSKVLEMVKNDLKESNARVADLEGRLTDADAVTEIAANGESASACSEENGYKEPNEEKERIEELCKEVEDLQNVVSQFKTTENGLYLRIKELEGELATIKSDADFKEYSYKSMIETVSSETKELRTELQETIQKEQALQTKIQDLQECLESQTQQSKIAETESNNQLNMAQDRIKALTDKLEHIKTEAEHSKQQSESQYEQRLNELTKTIEKLEKETQEHEQSRDELSRRNAKLSERLQSAILQNDEHVQQMQRLKTMIQSLSSTVAMLKGRQKEMQSAMSAQEEALRSAVAQYDMSKSFVVDHEKKVMDASSELETLVKFANEGLSASSAHTSTTSATSTPVPTKTVVGASLSSPHLSVGGDDGTAMAMFLDDVTNSLPTTPRHAATTTTNAGMDHFIQKSSVDQIDFCSDDNNNNHQHDDHDDDTSAGSFDNNYVGFKQPPPPTPPLPTSTAPPPPVPPLADGDGMPVTDTDVGELVGATNSMDTMSTNDKNDFLITSDASVV